MKFLKANGLERKRKMEKQKMITKERCGREVKERGDGAVMWEKRKRDVEELCSLMLERQL